MNGSIVTIILAVIMLALAGYQIYKVVQQTNRINAGKSWPVVTARVIDKVVHTSRGSKGNTTYSPEITYKFSVMGREYTKNTRLSGMWSWNSAQKLIDQVGETMEIRYNPNKPEESTHGFDKVRVADYLLIAVVLILAIVLIVLQVL